MDYTKYKYSFKEMAILLSEASVASLVVGYLFYDSLWGLVLLPFILVFISRIDKAKRIKKRKDQLTGEFIDFLKNISTALLAGYSMENAWIEGQKELGLLHGTESIMYKEVSNMNHGIKVNISVETVLEDFAKRSGVEEIMNFSEIFSYAKKSGGNFVRIIETTTNRISKKYEAYREIEVSLAAKKLEQNVMNFIPAFILAYMKLTSPDYMSVLYTGIVGNIFMTVCLAVYGGALLLSGKILNISA